MTKTFDPYRKWLGIPPKDQPPNHYRLLGIALYEDDPDVIENAADRQMAHVRTFQTGQNAAHSQRILNELSAAKVTLLNKDRREAYNAELRKRIDSAAHDSSLGSSIGLSDSAIGSSIGMGDSSIHSGPPPVRKAPPRSTSASPPPAAAAAPPVAKAEQVDTESEPPPAKPRAESNGQAGLDLTPSYASLVSGKKKNKKSTSSTGAAARRKKSNMPMIALGSGVGMVVIVLLMVVFSGGSGNSGGDSAKKPPARKQPNGENSKTNGGQQGKLPSVQPDKTGGKTPPGQSPTGSNPGTNSNTLPANGGGNTQPNAGGPDETGGEKKIPGFLDPNPPTGGDPDIPDLGFNPQGPDLSGTVGDLLSRARDSIGRRELTLADKYVAKAREIQSDQEERERVDHVASLLTLSQSFWSKVKAKIEQAQVGDRFVLPLGNDATLGQVEIKKKPAKGVIEFPWSGRDMISSARDIPVPAAAVIATSDLSLPGPSNSTADNDGWGAALLALALDQQTGQANKRREVAKKLYEGANKRYGFTHALAAKELVVQSELTGTAGNNNPPPPTMAEPPKPVPPEQLLPVPKGAALTDARRIVRAKYDSRVRIAARLSPEDATLFFDQLTNEARTAKDPATRYALLEKIVLLAEVRGDTSRGLAAIEEQAAQYKIDVFDVKREHLTKLNRPNAPPAHRAEVARLSAQTAEAALEAKDFKQALALARLGRAAANGLPGGLYVEMNELIRKITAAQKAAGG